LACVAHHDGDAFVAQSRVSEFIAHARVVRGRRAVRACADRGGDRLGVEAHILNPHPRDAEKE